MNNDDRGLYGRNTDFLSSYESCIADNRPLIRQWYGTHLERIEAMLSVQHDIIARHVWTFNGLAAEPDAIGQLQFAAAHKGLVALYSAYRMVSDGLFGPARPLLRYVFEIQMIAKFVSAANDHALADKWGSGQPIYFMNAILKRIRRPDSGSLRKFWGDLNKVTHAAPNSLQISPMAQHNKSEMRFDIAVMQILLDSGFHLLSSHTFTSQVRYYARFYVSDELRDLRSRARQLRSDAAKHYSHLGKAVARSFRASWQTA